MVPIRHQSKGEMRSISVRPLARLARCASVESVLNDFAEIAVEKGIDLCSVRFICAGLQREFKSLKAAEADCNADEIEIGVEGGQTRLVVKFHGPLSDAIQYEIEDAAHLATHRIELLAERRSRPERAGQGRELSPVIEGLIGDSEPMRRIKDAILTAARNNSTVLG